MNKEKQSPDREKTDNTVPDKKEENKKPREIGGHKGPEPTRFGDWELGGKCVDF